MFRYCCTLFDYLMQCLTFSEIQKLYLVIMVSTVCKGGKKWTGPKCVLCTKYSSTALFSPSVLRTLFWWYIVVNGISMLSGWYVKAFTHAEVMCKTWIPWSGIRAKGLFFHSYLGGRYTQGAAVLSCCCESEHGLFVTGHSYPENVLHIFVVMTDLKTCTKSVLHLIT